MPDLRLALFAGVVAAAGALAASSAPSAEPPSRRAAAPPTVTVYYSPSCGCCKKWVDHLKANGFTTKSVEQEDLSQLKADLGVTAKVRSCHTAMVAGYVIEGHVPAADITRLLGEKPRITGLAAPGMPAASPGMDSGKEPYDVVTFDAKGNTTVWARH
jgi:hypothetical protein